MSILQNKRLRKTATWGIVALYLAAGLWFLGVHEPWRDEAHAWQIAVSIGSFVELISIPPYEGTPVLWHLLLWGLHSLGAGFAWARVLNIVFVLVAVAVFVWKAPFKLWQRALFPFGYFILFEFSTVSRSYGLLVFLLLLIAWLWKRRMNQPLILAALLALLAHANVFGWIIAVTLGVLFVFDYVYIHYLAGDVSKSAVSIPQDMEPSYFVSLVLGVAGIVSVPILMLPHYDVSPHLLGVVSIDASFFSHVVTQLLRVFVPLSSVELQFWNNVWNPSVTEIILGVLLLLGSVLVFKLYSVRYRWMFAYTTVTVSVVGLLTLKGIQHIRFSGIVFVVWIAFLWIGRVEAAQLERIVSTQFRRVADGLVGIILLVQIVSIIPAVLFDGGAVFSQSHSAAEYLIESGYDTEDVLLASGFTSVGSAVLPYLTSEQIFSPELGRFVEKILWDRAYHNGVLYSPDEVVKAVEAEYIKGEYVDVVILFNDPHGDEYNGYTLEASFTDSIVPDEDFYIYRRK